MNYMDIVIIINVCIYNIYIYTYGPPQRPTLVQFLSVLAVVLRSWGVAHVYYIYVERLLICKLIHDLNWIKEFILLL